MKLNIQLVILFVFSYSMGQEMVFPLKFNNKLYHSSTPKLTLRSDTINYKITVIGTSLPFIDDFSTDNRLTKSKINANINNTYITQGVCNKSLNYFTDTYKFNKNSAYSYNFIFGVPNRVDSFLINPINWLLLEDSTNCDNITNVIQIYPEYYRYQYDMNTGKKLDSILISDTTLHCAWVHAVSFKNGINWLDEYAYFNDHFAFMPPSIGVATLDGLNEKGRAYDPVNTNSYGLADYLTSNKINLNGRLKSDSTFLSFLAQPQGFGDWPDVKDSLVVQLKDIDNIWHSVYKIEGLTQRQNLDSNLVFKHHLIYIPGQDVPSDPNYYHEDFQFRFLNYATLSGNNDHWNIDYVRLDTARTSTDTTIKDATFVYNLPSILKKYTLLPSKQFNGQLDLKDTLLVYNKNFLPAPILSTYKVKCINENLNATIFQSPTGIPYSADPLSIIQISPNLDFVIPPSIPDSTYIRTKVFLDASDNIETNDTAQCRQFFFNEMAYDDGSAEMAYGIQGNGLKKMAYKFIIPKKDTLAAIKMMFTTIDANVSSVVFNLSIWKSIGINGKPEQLIKTISNKKPIYIDTLNSFYTFGLDTPIVVQDSIYVGWTQSDENNIAVGYDRNSTLGFDKMYIFTNNLWSKSNIILQGSPLIRLILDGKRNYRSKDGSIINTISTTIYTINSQVYPNPCNEDLTINTNTNIPIQYVISDISGRLIMTDSIIGESKINISTIHSGIYILTLYQDQQQISSQKIIVQH